MPCVLYCDVVTSLIFLIFNLCSDLFGSGVVALNLGQHNYQKHLGKCWICCISVKNSYTLEACVPCVLYCDVAVFRTLLKNANTKKRLPDPFVRVQLL